jgi:hydroxyacylglutathione hydrolase
MFEGTPVQMNASLQRLSALPPATRVFCGHEYTAANLRFALTVDPRNEAAARYRELVDSAAGPRHAHAALHDRARKSRQSFFALR